MILWLKSGVSITDSSSECIYIYAISFGAYINTVTVLGILGYEMQLQKIKNKITHINEEIYVARPILAYIHICPSFFKKYDYKYTDENIYT